MPSSTRTDTLSPYPTLFRSPDGGSATFEGPVTEASVQLEAGDKVVLGHQPTNDPGFQYYFNDFQRRSPMLLLVAIFVVAVLALGRFQGLRALIGLAVTGVVMVAFLFPSILDGNDPTADRKSTRLNSSH